MKLRIQINNNAEKYVASVYEDNNKIFVVKSDNQNWNATRETFQFNSIEELDNWVRNQDWINPKKIQLISNFKNVK